MQITETCKCGATFTAEADMSLAFWLDQRHQAFLNAHKACREQVNYQIIPWMGGTGIAWQEVEPQPEPTAPGHDRCEFTNDSLTEVVYKGFKITEDELDTLRLFLDPKTSRISADAYLCSLKGYRTARKFGATL